MNIDEKALQEKIGESTALVKAELDKIDALIICDQQTFTEVETLDKAAAKAFKDVEGLRTFFVKPLNEHVDRINGLFKPFTTRLEAGREKLRVKRRDYLKAEAERQLAAEREAAAERQRAAEEQKLLAIDQIFNKAMEGVEYRLENAGIEEEFRGAIHALKTRVDINDMTLASTIRATAIEFFEQHDVAFHIPLEPETLAANDRAVVELQTEAALPPVRPVTPVAAAPKTKADKRGLKDRWRYRFVDEKGLPVEQPRLDLIPIEYLMPDDIKLGATARTHKGTLKVNGIEFYPE